MGNFDLRDNVEWKSRLIRGVRTEGQPYAVSRDDVDCKKTPRLITLLISKVTNYKMPERLVLTKILIHALLNYQRSTRLTTEQVHLVEFSAPRI